VEHHSAYYPFNARVLKAGLFRFEYFNRARNCYEKKYKNSNVMLIKNAGRSYKVSLAFGLIDCEYGRI